MEILFFILILLLFIVLIIGLINPQLIMFWSKKPMRIKVFGWWLLFTIIFGVIGSSFETDESKLDYALKQIKNKKYSSAISTLERISGKSEYFMKADSLILIAKKELELIKAKEQEIINKEKLKKDKEEHSEQLKKKYTKITAKVFAEEQVKKMLKSPSTASFNWNADDNITRLNDTTFYIKGYVDSQNSFGAELRSNYSCTVVYLDKLNMVRCDNLVIE